jgi:eukaryotic translation initiation factor 2C
MLTNLAGADVSHPAPGIQNRPSVASLVWSWDSDGCKYSAVTRVQHPRTEVIDELRSMMKVCGAVAA